MSKYGTMTPMLLNDVNTNLLLMIMINVRTNNACTAIATYGLLLGVTFDICFENGNRFSDAIARIVSELATKTLNDAFA